MNEFHEHPDGYVFVRAYIDGEDKEYGETRANFEKDFGRPLEPLPDGAVERIYVRDVRHAINSRDTTIEGGPIPWSYGDDAIAAVDGLRGKKHLRDEALKQEAEAKHKAEMEKQRLEFEAKHGLPSVQ